jgi:hypothetical protein
MQVDNWTGDIDIDCASRDQALAGVQHICASLHNRVGRLDRHTTGVYFHNVPQDPVTGLCSVPYKQAEQLGFFKIDILNVHVYEKVRDEAHLIQLMTADFNWDLLGYSEFVSLLIHLHNHADLVARLKPCNIPELAITLALIRPGKAHLIDKCIQQGFASIASEIWQQTNDKFAFKKSHSLGYAMLVKVHAQILLDELATA